MSGELFFLEPGSLMQVRGVNLWKPLGMRWASVGMQGPRPSTGGGMCKRKVPPIHRTILDLR
jgi:hypothetical protein